VFLKNYDLKTQTRAYSNRKQCDAFLKTQNFKRLTCDFKGQTLNCFFKNHFFKLHILKLLFLKSHFLKSKTQTEPKNKRKSKNYHDMIKGSSNGI
jgi:hypothetical protein